MPMMSGRDALLQIDSAVSEERRKIDEVDQHIQEASDQLIELRKARAEDFRELARLRVGMIAGQRLVAGLAEADRQAAALLASRGTALAALEQRIQAAGRHRSALETERSTQADVLDAASDAVDAVQAATQARLDAQPDYRAQQVRTQEAERVARHADDKATRSEQELGQKGQSYRDDPLFMYLWERAYGLPAYKATSLTRWLDGRVARLIGYDDARANYSRLQEIPVRLREHAQATRQQAEAEFQALRALDEKARAADGIPALEAARDQERARLEAIDARIEEAAAGYQRLLDEKAAFASGEDEASRKAVEYLASEFQRDDLQALRRDARATPFPEDDLVINRLLEREEDERTLETSLSELKQAAQQHHVRLGQIESLRVDFRRSQYDQGGSTFADGTLLGVMLGNFLSGLLDRDGLWRVLQQQQRYRPQRSDPTFGSGGFGRGSVWGGGAGRGGGGMWGGGRGGGGGGGGFRTGGGF